jgi:electron transfer flavoprotein beta subunit
MGAKKKPLETVTAGEVDIDASKVGGENSAAQWIAAKAPPAKAAGEIIEDEDTGETVEKIVAWLDERKLI